MATEKHVQGSTLSEITQSIAHMKLCGIPVDLIVRQLVERGWPESSARQFVANVKMDTERDFAGGQNAGYTIPGRDEPLYKTVRRNSTRASKLSDAERHEEMRYSRLRVLRGLMSIIIGLSIIVVSLTEGDPYVGLFLFAIGVLLCTLEAIDIAFGIAGWWKNRG